MTKFLITGGAGFIGSALIRRLCKDGSNSVLNVDKLTYAGCLDRLVLEQNCSNYQFSQIDITDSQNIDKVIKTFQPNVIFHLAAESHVDNSIVGSEQFIKTNIIGTHVILEKSREYFEKLSPKNQASFRFIHVSTDEVFGDLSLNENPFSEEHRYLPSSPYSASKASSDHLARAWFRTYGLPVIVTNCSNNYGPYHHPEKFIPKAILNMINGIKVPIYGSGEQIRDWLFVEDHCEALIRVSTKGKIGESYNIGGNCEISNLEVLKVIHSILLSFGDLRWNKLETDFEKTVDFVEDRLGHDYRYAINNSKIIDCLNWQPNRSFEEGIYETVLWYLNNKKWWTKFFSIEELDKQ